MCDKGRGRQTLKYKDLTIEIQFMWNVKIKVVPVIVGGQMEQFKNN
jgi:hypothetical protein